MTVAMRTCPLCKEDIRAEAVVCKHCRSKIESERPSHEGTCPFCKEDVKPDAIKCKHCGSFIGQLNSECCQGCGDSSSLDATALFMRQRPVGNSDYGQGCYYDCIEGCTVPGQPTPYLVRKLCEAACQISMPGNFRPVFRR